MSDYTQNRIEAEAIDIATIALGQQTSDAINVKGRILVGVRTPAALTGTTLTLQISIDGTTFLNYYNSDGNLITITMAPDRHIGLLPADLAGVQRIKIVSGSAEGAQRQIQLVFRGI